jgi:chromosome segregation ATPase
VQSLIISPWPSLHVLLLFFAQELKHRKSSIRRRQEELEHDGESTQQQRVQILERLRAQVAESEEQLEETRRQQRAVELEVGTLRGRLAHATKEQAQWETDNRVQSDKECEEAMQELRRLRRVTGRQPQPQPPPQQQLLE